MRIRVLSDLHLEFQQWKPPPVSADVIVLAGDIDVGADGIEWARSHFPSAAIVYVPGNHEFYGAQWQDVSSALREVGEDFEVSVLDGDSVTIDGVRFLGATLWTDFALHGEEPEQIARAMVAARRGIRDFSVIRFGNEGSFRPEHARELHLSQATWLRGALAEPFHGATVVVTHFLPHPRSIHPRYADSELNPCFASDLDDIVREPVALWIHGHTHDSCDYVVNGTRVVCNPRGYLPREPNPGFQPGLVIDV